MPARAPALAVALAAALVAAVGAVGAVGAEAPELHGFSLEGATVPPEHILAGGPPRDGIHSVDHPEFVPVPEADWVAPQNPVLGVMLGGEAHVYPVHVIERHQIVNDTLGGVPVVVTYDPLAGAPLAFRREVGGRVLEFGVSGLLYDSAFLMYDRVTESLWSPMLGQAVAGPLAGTALERVPIRQETLAMWLERAPKSTVLVRPTKAIDYRYSPFQAYWISEKIPSRVDARDDRFHPKEVVVGVSAGGIERAYLGSLVTAAGGTLHDEVAGYPIEIEYYSESAVFRWKAPPEVRVTESYWFAWKAFHPDTQVWHDPDE